jgi:hypothetical protein
VVQLFGYGQSESYSVVTIDQVQGEEFQRADFRSTACPNATQKHPGQKMMILTNPLFSIKYSVHDELKSRCMEQLRVRRKSCSLRVIPIYLSMTNSFGTHSEFKVEILTLILV